MKLLLVLGCQIVYCPSLRRYYPGRILQKRLDRAIEAYLQLSDCIVVVSGGSRPTRNVTEAEVMKQYLVERGVPHYKIFEERYSRNTVENCLASFELIQQMKGRLTYQEVSSANPLCNYYGSTREGFIYQFDPIIVISSDFHMPRVQKIFHRYNRDQQLLFVASETPFDLLPSCLEKERMLLQH